MFYNNDLVVHIISILWKLQKIFIYHRDLSHTLSFSPLTIIYKSFSSSGNNNKTLIILMNGNNSSSENYKLICVLILQLNKIFLVSNYWWPGEIYSYKYANVILSKFR